jgi:hypothetical protein
MNPHEYTSELASAARKAIRHTVQAVNPILGAIMAVLNAEPESYHRHADLCPCSADDTHAQECPVAILELLNDAQKGRLYRFACHIFDPACPNCERENGLARSYEAPKRGGLRMIELD